MSILSAASGASVWRGYEYYAEKKVTSFVRLGEDEYEGLVAGTLPEPYHVKIDIAHTRSSKCDCPHASGRRIICKHMVALYFTAFPQEAAKYIAQMEEYEREEKERRAKHYAEIRAYVNSLSKKELQAELFQILIDLEESDDHYW